MKAPFADKNTPFVETPRGIFTAAGNWFYTTVAALREYAGPVLERKTVAQLVRIAELWLRSPITLVLWLAPILLWQLGLAATLACSLALFFILNIWGPAFLIISATPLLKILDRVETQALFYVVVMSWFAINQQFVLMSTGLAIFVIMRWGLLYTVLRPVIEKIRARLYVISYSDQLLKAVVLRVAMKYGISIPELSEMERAILRRINRT